MSTRAPTVVVVGASRGIGLELVRQYAAAGWRVHGTTRTPDRPGALGTIDGEVRIHALEVCDRAQVGALAATLAGVAVDVLVHNAGVYGSGMARAEVMRINAEAPIGVASALVAAVARAPGSKIVLMSSQMGSRGSRRGSLGVYGDSKAALNDAFRRVEPEWRRRGVISVVMHPGWVRTDMGGRHASLSVEESVRGIRQVIAKLEPGDAGRFLAWDGSELSW